MLRALRSKPETGPVLAPRFPTRGVACPTCGYRFEAALRAVTLKCAGCGRYLECRHAFIRRKTSENITTIGRVHIARRGSLRGRIDCAELLVEGTLSGEITVRGPARIDGRGSVSGSLHADEITIEPGGRLRGTLSVGAEEDRPREDARD